MTKRDQEDFENFIVFVLFWLVCCIANVFVLRYCSTFIQPYNDVHAVLCIVSRPRFMATHVTGERCAYFVGGLEFIGEFCMRGA